MVNAEFFDALEQLEKEKGIPVDYMLDRVGQALITAYKRDNDGMTDNVYVEPNREERPSACTCARRSSAPRTFMSLTRRSPSRRLLTTR